ncbi:tRNA (adenine(22)-N(1))-methyltransferase [Photobacterium kagoshimensis]|uniref:tRNA (adenine(22)-N(1))-methyltransferase n=1 Tax=Photobacterium kagoshimensis TaxID=2910242 RepID=UPI003D0DF8E8
MKLSKRLRKIEQMVTSDYSHIWDCCCDHGFLGAALLSRQAANNIHFVDIVPDLMSELASKLQRFYSDSASNWYTHCLDVAELPLQQHEGKQLIIIAGVGGDLMIQFIEALHRKHALASNNSNIDFLLCPVHHQFALRQKLIELNFSLKDEALVEDNQRFYETILVSSKPDESAPISFVGDKIWQSDSDKQANINQKYLIKTLNHYQRIQQGNTTDVSHIIDAYRAITL